MSYSGEFCDVRACSCANVGSKTLPRIPAFQESSACSTSGECSFVQIGNYTQTDGLMLTKENIMFADGSVGVVPPASSNVIVGVITPTDKDAAIITAITKLIRSKQDQNNSALLPGYNFNTKMKNSSNCQTGDAMISMMSLMELSPVAIVGDGCDSTTVALQSVAASSPFLLLGWGASTPQLYKTDYFISTADSIRHYLSGIFELCTRFGITFLALIVDADNNGDADSTFSAMVKDQKFELCGTYMLDSSTQNTMVSSVLDSVVHVAARAVVVLTGPISMANLVPFRPTVMPITACCGCR